MPGDFLIRYSLEKHLQSFHDPRNVYLTILDDEGEVAGYFLLVQEDAAGSVECRRICVDEGQRGIGQAAIRLMEAFCTEELNATRIWLDVFDHNPRGKHIYRKLGYTPFHEGMYAGKKCFSTRK